MKETIFISHATPEDNEFTIWIASRLELLGYKIWIDKNELLGGEKFWEEIEKTIKEKSIKFLLVYSNNICDINNPGKIKSGIQKEVDFAKTILSQDNQLKDFITLLHIDQSPFNLFDGSQELNQIVFNSNWAEGLEVLLKKFSKDNIPRSSTQTTNSFSKWYLDEYLIKNQIIKKRELYYTNWWSVEQIPQNFFIFKYKNEEQAKAISEINKNIISVTNANCITSFERNLNSEILHNNEKLEIIPEEIYAIKISDILLGFERETFPNQRDAENHFKKLLKRSLHTFFKENKLYWYELANKNQAYYHTPSSLPSSKVNFIYQFRKKHTKKNKKLYGKYLTLGKWHFALSLKPMLNPYLGFAIKSHIVFTDHGFKTWEDKALLHSHRRKKGKRMFNEEWRDLLLAFIQSLKNENAIIEIKVSESEHLIMKSNVESFWSDYGYFDPKDKNRQNIFIYEERDEEIEDIEDVVLEPEPNDN